jgi:hypothetical protein
MEQKRGQTKADINKLRAAEMRVLRNMEGKPETE